MIAGPSMWNALSLVACKAAVRLDRLPFFPAAGAQIDLRFLLHFFFFFLVFCVVDGARLPTCFPLAGRFFSVFSFPANFRFFWFPMPSSSPTRYAFLHL